MSKGAAELVEQVRAACERSLPAATPLVVAFSGGLDSTVLLHLLCSQSRHPLRAVYVDHGLHPDSPHWARQCAAVCAERDVPFKAVRIEVSLPAADGLEAEARRLRYAAMARELVGDEVLVTAHHERDQLETVLLQLLRGTGAAGLAGMPVLGEQQGVSVFRPLLAVPHDRLRAAAEELNLSWIEDPSNEQLEIDRNYLRREVLPAVLKRWPAAGRTVSRAARLSALNQAALEELGRADLAAARLSASPLVLSARVLRGLSEARRANAIRCAVVAADLPVPTESQLQVAIQVLLRSRSDATPLAAWPGARVRRYRDQLWFYPEAQDPGGPHPDVDAIRWKGESALELPGARGRLRLEPTAAGGIRQDVLERGLSVRFRVGGERLRLRADGPRREVKKLLQENDVLPWMRCHIPLVYARDTLVAIPDIGCAAEASAPPDSAGYRLIWEDHPPIKLA